MDLISSIILGIVEGLTEFVPVSSTGHLIISSRLLGLDGEVTKFFEVFIQLGAILAVVVLYKARWLAILDLKQNSNFSGRAGMLKLIAASAPFVVLGVLLHRYIKEHLFTTSTVAIGLIIGGIALILVEKLSYRETADSLDNLSLKQSFVIGLFQCFALWPGFSRSASTIVGGIFSGLPRAVSAEFSFLVAVPIMFLVVGGDFIKNYHLLSAEYLPSFITGFLVSFIVALITIKWFMSLLARYNLVGFGWYRIVLGLITIFVFS